MTAETVKIDTPDSRATSEILAALPGFCGLVRFEDMITNARYQGPDMFSKRLAILNQAMSGFGSKKSRTKLSRS